jgi:5'-nucleotidase
MRILITNDDGINSEGLAALRAALLPLGEVIAIAPERPRSACGHAVTLHKPLRLTPVNLPDGGQSFASNGTPADCVALGTSEHLGPRPDLVVSGINLGPNLGADMLYSGTVAAAMEAAICGLPSFAVSVASYRASDFRPAADFAHCLAGAILQHGLPTATFLNVNVPAVPVSVMAGLAFTRQGSVRYANRIERRTDPRGVAYYWLSGDRVEHPGKADTDAHAVAHNRISITPVCLDLSDDKTLAQLPDWDLRWPPQLSSES